jgi:hypothetical protein
MRNILFALAAVTLMVTGYALATGFEDSGLTASERIVQQTAQKCLPNERMDEQTKKCVKK